MKMRVADYIAEFVANQQIKNVFMIVGGFSMHLVDAFANHKDIKYTCMHHEQALAMAAEGYARETGTIGVACVTAGPGMTNALTGVVGAYFDSTPCMIIGGQTKTKEIKYNGLRQFGIQGFETLPIFEHVTKYAVVVEDPKTIRYHLEKALFIAKSGRPGPVWIEIPLDVQGSLIEPSELNGFEKPEADKNWKNELIEKLPKLLEMLKTAKRPLFLFGNGLRTSNSITLAISIAEKLQIPVITSRLAIDSINSDHPLFVGRPGLYGDRPSHFAIQNADLIISIGCRHCISLIGYDYKEFGKHAKKVVVDVEAPELKKPTLNIDVPINCDAKVFLEELNSIVDKLSVENHDKWVRKCREWKENYPIVLSEYAEDSEGINSYYFTDALSKHMKENDTVVLDTSSCFHVVSQAIKIKKGQRFMTTGGLSTMGYALPTAVGVSVVKQHGQTVCIAGDGSLQMNIQELQTMAHYKLPIKLFVWNNDGYLLIRHTQNSHMKGRLVGESTKSGLSCPDLEKLAWAYGIKFIRVAKVSKLDDAINETLNFDGPVICEIVTPHNQLIVPRISSEKLPDGRMISKAYDDLYPFLDRETYEKESNYFKSEG